METPVGSVVLQEKIIPNFQNNYSKDRLPGEVEVAPTKSLVPPTRRKRRSGPIFLGEFWRIDEPGSDEPASDEPGSDESGCDDDTSMLSSRDTYTEDDRISILNEVRRDFKYNVRDFKTQYSYGAYGPSDSPTFMMDMMDVRHCITSNTPYVMMDVRHCITSLTRNAFALPEESSGIMWVGVHTGNDICVVTPREDVDFKRVQGWLRKSSPKHVVSMFRKCVLSELEDLADPTSKLCEKLHMSIDAVPFCVVSASTPVDPQTFDESGRETSSSAIHVPEAVAFVQGSGLLEQATDSRGAIKLAVSAFERLMGKEFDANKIEVTVVSGLRNGRVMIWESFYEIRQYAQE